MSQSLQQGWEFAVRTGDSGPVQFVLDDVEGAHEADLGRLALYRKCGLGNLQSYKVVGNQRPQIS